MAHPTFDVFLSYAHEDDKLRQQLGTHLALLKRQQVIRVWHDRMIAAGGEWEPEISDRLEAADVVLLLVSPDFLASDYCIDIEMERALERHDDGTAMVIPILLRPCDWKSAPFGRIQGLPKDGRPVTRWTDRDEAWLNVAKGIRLACEEFGRRRGEEKAGQPADSKPWNVPFERNPFFTGRQDVLTQLHDALGKRRRAVIGQAISGLGGIGKTQTAVEYAYRHRDDYEAVFWVRAESESEIHSGMVEIAKSLSLPQAAARDQSLVIAASHRWLEEHDDWLMICDNADRPELLKPYLPREIRGRILVTSRASSFGGLGIRRPFEITTLPPDEAAAFLLDRVRRETGPEDRLAAAELAAELGCLPLALEQAGAYLEAVQGRFAAYLQSYRKRQLGLLEKLKPQTGDYGETVATAWAMNFRKVEARSPASADFLRVCAFLAPDAIPLELFEEGASELGPTLAAALADRDEDPIAISEVLEPLLRFSLVRRDVEHRTVSVHRLVQAVMRAGMDEPAEQAWVERLIEALNRTFPADPEFETWPQCERLYPHIQVTASLAKALCLSTLETARMLFAAGWYAAEHAWYAEAASFQERSLKIREDALGPNHLDVATSLNYLANIYKTQGRYENDEPLQVRSLAIREKVLGPDHPDTATSLNDVGALYIKQSRYQEADPILRRALAIREKTLGPDHLDVARSLNNLASLYLEQGSHEESKALFKRALTIQEKALGPDHPEVATLLNNLGRAYEDQGRFKNALPLFKRANEIHKRTLGPNHPDFALSLQNLAAAYGNLGRFDQAKPLLQRALAILKKTLGAKHPTTVAANRNLQQLLRAGRGPGRR